MYEHLILIFSGDIEAVKSLGKKADKARLKKGYSVSDANVTYVKVAYAKKNNYANGSDFASEYFDTVQVIQFLVLQSDSTYNIDDMIC